MAGNVIVVDVGCAPQGAEHSEDILIERFRPYLYLGFDPYPELHAGVFQHTANGHVTTIVRSQMAAWVHDGFVSFDLSPLEPIKAGVVAPGDSAAVVACFDFCNWLRWLVLTHQDFIVLKFDCEGAEFPILQKMRDQNLDLLVRKILVEWHAAPNYGDDYYGHGWAGERPELRCEVEAW